MKPPLALLVNPWIYDFAAYDLWAKPLGLLYLAGWLRDRGVRVRLWDAMGSLHPRFPRKPPVRRRFGTGKFYRRRVAKPRVLAHVQRDYFRYGLPPETLLGDLREMQSDPPDLVLVTSLMTYWYPGVVEAVRLVKKVFPRVPLLLGGIYATLCTDHARRHTEADYVARGPGEALLAEFLERELNFDMAGGRKGGFGRNPYPAFDLVQQRHYLCVLTSRGCPYRCHYCASRLLYPRFEEREPASVFEEIRYQVERFGIRDVAFYDDALLVHAERRIVPLLERIRSSGLALRFHTPNGLHLREITPKLARLMRDSGFATLRFGYESSDMEWHRRTGGKVGGGDLETALVCLREAGFRREEVGVYILMGAPGQTPDQVEQSIRHVQAAGGRPFLAEYSPIPGTKMWSQALAFSPYDLEAEPLFHNNSLLPCAPDEFTAERIRKLRRLCVAPP